MHEILTNPWADLEFLRVRQVAKLLSISRLGVYRLIEQGFLPVHRLTKCLLLKRTDVVDLLAKNRTAAWRDQLYGSQKD